MGEGVFAKGWQKGTEFAEHWQIPFDGASGGAGGYNAGTVRISPPEGVTSTVFS